MKIPSLQLEAFFEVAKARHFTLAAKNLHITQSALSQRILNLESGLGVSLFIRDRANLRLTEPGEALLRYCQTQNLLEDEVVQVLRTGQQQSAGWLRMAGFSSVMWSVIVPALGDFVRTHDQVRLEFRVNEVSELLPLLRRGEVDMIVTAEKPEGADWKVTEIGTEENVLVTSAKVASRKAVYLDHDKEDPWTLNFLKKNGQSTKNIRRDYLEDIAGLTAGVVAGWGQAVLPVHLVRGRKDLQVVKHFKPLKTPILLVQHRLSYGAKLLERVTQELKEKSPPLLA